MKKSLFFSLLTGALLAGCSSSDLETTYEKEVLQYREIPVEFGTFLGNAANTRAGEVGELTTTALQASTSQGFGVFAYYTNDGNYSNSSDAGSTPNFMYNEQVTYGSSGWTYSPIKYWPNEFQTSGTGGTAANIDKLTFFAYAPWVGTSDGKNTFKAGLKETIGENNVEVGITAFSANDHKGDPTVSYKVATKPANSVDLLWATNNSLETPTAMNMTKPTVGTKVQFTFGHALSRLGMKIRAVVDETAKDGTKDLATGTTIYLKKITVKGSAMYDNGELNLHTGVWGSLSTTTGFNLSVEGDDIALTDKKVTNTLQDVMNAASATTKKYFMFIPNESSDGGDLEITVEYSVETADPALAGTLGDGTTAGIKIDNVITNKLTAFKPAKGKAYNLDILIGVTSVEVAATVTNWDDSTTSSEIWVPINKSSSGS